ncbi:MAG: GumC family protein [Thermodesulfobacteriota bacterium]
MELKRYWQIILKRRGTLLKIIGIIVATVILGSFIISPVYQFKCNIWVKTADPKVNLTGMPENLATLGIIGSELVMYTQLAMIKNLSMIEDVIKKMELEKRKGILYGASEFLNPGSLDLIFNKKGVSVSPVASTQIIQVSGFSSSPQEAADIANQVADSFVSMYNQNIQTTAKQALGFIQESIPKVSAQLNQAEKALADYKVANHISNVTYLREKLLTNIATLQETKDTNETELAGIEKKVSGLQAKLKKIPEFQKGTQEYRTNATLEYIRQKLMDAESNMASGGIKAMPEYITQRQYRASIEKLKDEYRQQAAKLFYSETSTRNSVHTALIQTLVENEIDLAVRTARRQQINQNILDRQKELDDLTLKELQAMPLQREVTALQNTMANLLTQEQVAKMAAHMDLSNATIVERAVVPVQSDQIKRFRWFPKRKILTMFSLVFGLFLGMTTILFQEYLDDCLSDPGETEEYLKFPVLASLPELPPSETFDLDRIMSYPPWPQAIWSLPDMVRPAGKEAPSGVWSITSTNPGEGKTLVAATLGWALASRGLRVLLIDLNFFHPTLSSMWGLAPGEGVKEILQETANLTDCLKQVGPGELYLLPNGRAQEVAWSQLDPKVLAQWLATVRPQFDVLLLDLPAVGSGEGAPLAALGEQILMVMAADHSPKTQVARALEQIQRCHGRIAGLVLNRYKKLELWPLVSSTASTITSWPPVKRLFSFVEKHSKFRLNK